MIFGDGQALATISLMVLADNIPEATEIVTITLVNVTTVDLQDQDRAAVLDWSKRNAILTILPNDSPYGVIGWHPDSLFISVQEPGSKFCLVIAEQQPVYMVVVKIKLHVINTVPCVKGAR